MFVEYAEMVQTKFNKRIAVLRCDNGGEYKSQDFKLFCKKNGTVIDFTNPYTPEQNGKSERYNRSLVEKARSMMQHADVPKEFWDEAVRTAAYLINRSPSANLEDATPAEVWYGKKPDVSNLTVFGCIAYSHIPKELRNKFDAKVRKCVMLGYNNNGYRLWSVDKQEIVASRDVMFNESMFYYKVHESRGKMIQVDDDFEEIGNARREDEKIENKTKRGQEQNSNKSGTFEEAEGIEEKENSKGEGIIDNQKLNERRISRKPQYLNDYEMYMAFDAISYVEQVPKGTEDINGLEDKNMWKDAMKREIEAIEKNGTWHPVKPPDNVEILDTKWVFAKKPLEEDVRLRYKARLVVKGFAQKNSFVFDEIYSPVAKMSTIKVLLAIGNQYSFYFIQLNVKTAFLNAKLTENVYMYPPEGVNYCKPNQVLKLDKSLYELKQSSKCWNNKINSFLVSLGFKRSDSDYCLYSKFSGKSVLYLLLYVDDIIIAGPDLNVINFYKEKLSNEFEVRVKGNLKDFLGLEIQYDREGGILKLSQSRYLKCVLKKFNFEGCAASAIPIDPGLKLNVSKNITKQSDKPIRELVGCLMYLMLGSRPDISFAVNYFSRFQDKNTHEVWSHMKRILRYLKGSENTTLVYTRNENCVPLTCFVDADWGGDINDRKSVSGFIIKIFGNTVSWVTRKQNCVALSTTEAELVALCSPVQDSLWFKKLLSDLNVNVDIITIFEDNRGCIFLTKNPENNRRVKRIDLKFHFVHEQIKTGKINIEYLNTRSQQADILTKGLNRLQFYRNCTEIGLDFYI